MWPEHTLYNSMIPYCREALRLSLCPGLLIFERMMLKCFTQMMLLISPGIIFSISSPTISCRTPGVIVWLHNQGQHAEDVAAYRPSPLAHYGQLKDLPKIIPLFHPQLPDHLAGGKLADVTGAIHLEFTRPIMDINTQSIPGMRDQEYIRYFVLHLRNK